MRFEAAPQVTSLRAFSPNHAQEILRHARNECEDQDRIEFVRRIEHASENPLVAS
jgi:hypothetical protein